MPRSRAATLEGPVAAQGSSSTGGRWTTIRPWQPPSASSSSASASHSSSSNHVLDGPFGRYKLQVVDLTSTALALCIHSHKDEPDLASSAIAVSLNGRSWPHVAHAGTVPVRAPPPAAPLVESEPTTPVDNEEEEEACSYEVVRKETTVIVYGLEADKDYTVDLCVNPFPLTTASTATTAPSTAATATTATRDDETPDEEADQAAIAETEASPQAEQDEPSSASVDPPPPYTAAVAASVAPPTTATTEASLRALLKKLRTSSKRTETVLQSSISALKKSVEKGMKEDQRARSRIVALEEAIRKAKQAEEGMRTDDIDAIEERKKELEIEEAEVLEELKEKKSSTANVTASTAPATSATPPTGSSSKETPASQSHSHGHSHSHEASKDHAEDEDISALAQLAKELDSLNRSIEELQSDRLGVAHNALQSLESELSMIEMELLTMDRHDAIHGIPPVQSSQASVPPASTSGFLKWRGPNNERFRFFKRGQQQQQAPQQKYPSNRNSSSADSSPLPTNYSTALPSPDQNPAGSQGSFDAQAYAQNVQTQSRSFWGSAFSSSPRTNEVLHYDAPAPVMGDADSAPADLDAPVTESRMAATKKKMASTLGLGPSTPATAAQATTSGGKKNKKRKQSSTTTSADLSSESMTVPNEPEDGAGDARSSTASKEKDESGTIDGASLRSVQSEASSKKSGSSSTGWTTKLPSWKRSDSKE